MKAPLSGNGTNVNDAWFTVNGERYGNWTLDMSDALRNDDAGPTDINTEPPHNHNKNALL